MRGTGFSTILVTVAIGALVGIGIERFILQGYGQANAPASGETVLEHARKHLDPDYVCPMHPDVQAPQPGSCPVCGMDLVARKREPASSDAQGPPAVTVTPEFIHNFGVRTAPVTRGPVARRIETIGRVARMPQSRQTAVAAPVAGKLVELTDKPIGAPVRAGEQLYALDSPAWRGLQQRFHAAVEDGDDNLQAQLKAQLRQAGMPPERIEQLQSSGEIQQILDVRAPRAGTLVARSRAVGDSVPAQAAVVALGGSRRIPVVVSAFEGQGAWIERGQPVTVRVPTLPDTVFRGTVDRTDRDINFSTRTLPVYVGFNTADPRIRYGMLVDVVIEAAERQNVLRVPREALIRTGGGDRVILALGEGRFRPVEVVTGLESGALTEVLSGLEAGQEVVISGQFLIDSESSLSSGLRRLGSGSDTP